MKYVDILIMLLTYHRDNVMIISAKIVLETRQKITSTQPVAANQCEMSTGTTKQSIITYTATTGE